MTKIVLIEDDSSVRENLIKILSLEHYEVVATESGEEGVLLIKRNMPDLIICDIMLPDIDGYEVLERIGKDNSLKHIPFVFLTARVEMDDLRKGMNLGADDYITKPFHIKDLLEAVKVRLEKSKSKKSALGTLIEDENKKLKLDQRLFLPVGSEVQFIIVKDILCITAEGPYTYLQTETISRILVRKLLKNWEEILPEESFLRIHKSTIINLNAITKIEKWFNSSYRVFIGGIENPFVISRRYAVKLRDNFRP